MDVSHVQSSIHGAREYQIIKDAANIEAVLVSFIQDRNCSMMHRKEPKKKRIFKLLEEGL